jgi:hypothetical protein
VSGRVRVDGWWWVLFALLFVAYALPWILWLRALSR